LWLASQSLCTAVAKPDAAHFLAAVPELSGIKLTLRCLKAALLLSLHLATKGGKFHLSAYAGSICLLVCVFVILDQIP